MLASSQYLSDTTLEQGTNVNIVHVSFFKNVNSNHNLNLVAMMGAVFVTQTMRTSNAWVAKRQHVTALHLSFKDNSISVILVLLYFFTEDKVEDAVTKRHFSYVMLLKQGGFFFFLNFRIILSTCHVLKHRFVPKIHICWISFNGGQEHNVPWKQWCTTHIFFPLKGLEVTSLLLKGRH